MSGPVAVKVRASDQRRDDAGGNREDHQRAAKRAVGGRQPMRMGLRSHGHRETSQIARRSPDGRGDI